MTQTVSKIDRTHVFPNGAMVSVFISGTWDRLIAERINWHGEFPRIPLGEENSFWDEFERFYFSVLQEARQFLSPEALHSNEALALRFPDRVHSLKNYRLKQIKAISLQFMRPSDLQIIPFVKDHLPSLLLSLGMPPMSTEEISVLSTPGHIFTAMFAGRVLGCAGVLPIRSGVGEAVAFLTDELRSKFPISLHKATLHFLDQIRREFHFHRVQLHVAVGFSSGCAWAQRLGFRWEGAMPLYGSDKKSFIRFGRTWA